MVILNKPLFGFSAKKIILNSVFILLLLNALPIFAASFIRLNQVGYKIATPARAYLMTTSSVSGSTFSIKNDGGTTVIAAAAIGAQIGTWGSYFVYPLDFTLNTSGRYTISVNGSASATSLSFNIDSSENLFKKALTNSLNFYQTQRDGSNFIPSALRTAGGHLNDASAKVYKTPSFDSDDNIIGSNLQATGATINAEGGWWDAGDYLKFVQTQSYTLAMMLVGIRDFPNAMGAGSSTSNFINEAKFGLDWLQKMWDDNSKTLYYQVGIGTDFTASSKLSDHDLWRLPQADDTFGGTNSTYQFIRNRPVFIAATAGSKISPNLAGRIAADFALCFTIFKTINPSYANQCLLSAEHVYDLANTAPSGDLLTVAPHDFYPEDEWRDDLELGATELYFAVRSGNLPPNLPHTDPNFYLNEAAKWAKAFINGPDDQADSLNLYDVSGLAHFDLYRAITLAGNPTLSVTKTQLLNDIAGQINTSLADSNDPFGSPYRWSFSDTASHVAGLSVMAAEYNYLKSDATFATYSQRWMNNVLGANAWGVSFIIGNGSLFPFCPQHQVANLVGTLNGKPPILSGAVVEGPTDSASSGSLDNMRPCPSGGGDIYKVFNAKGAVYKDNVQSYTTDEPAIDLTASSMLMFAWQIAGAPTGSL